MSGHTPIPLRLERVSKSYDRVTVVRDVSFEVAAGSFFSLLGPSGSGKSTILKVIGGFAAPSAGRVIIGTEDVTGLPPHRRPCNTIFQDLGLFPHMTVAENLAYGLRLRRVAAAERQRRVADILALVALQGVERRRIHQLSGGQRQRVALARALVLEPSVLLLDEPLTGLDEQLREQLRDEIGRLHRRLGATFLAVTHNQDEAFALSDRVAIMRAGCIEQIGQPQELFEAPANATIARFVGCDAILVPETVDPGPDSWVATVAGRRIACRAPPDRRHDMRCVVALRPERIRIAQLGEPSELGPATVTAAIYRGRDFDVEIALADGQKLHLLSPANGEAGLPDRGQVVELAWAPHLALLLADDNRNIDVQ